MAKRDATVTVKIVKREGGYMNYDLDIGVTELSITETVNHDLDVARLLKRLAVMVHPKVDSPDA